MARRTVRAAVVALLTAGLLSVSFRAFAEAPPPTNDHPSHQS